MNPVNSNAQPMSHLKRAIEIATLAHSGQVDKAGAPYIDHPLRVMKRLNGELARIVGVLHDVLEDSAWTAVDLAAEGFSGEVLEALDAVTRRAGEGYGAFVRRAGEHPVGRLVKLADLADNLDISRTPEPTAENIARLNKYQRAVASLMAAGKAEAAAS